MSGLYKQLLDNLSAAVLLLDRDLCVTYLNPSAEMLLELSARRILGSGIEALIPQPSEFYGVLQGAMESAHPFTRREAQLVLFSGRELVVDYSVTPMSGERPGGILVELQPRDRLIRISREEETRTAQETTRELVKGLAHEIKNPLGGIRGAAQLLNRALPEESLHDYTRVIIDEADRLQNLVDRMLGPRKLPNYQPLNIHKILERVYSLVHAETHGAVRIERDYDPSIPILTGDEEQLIQALLNIVRNSVQALQESHTAAPTIQLRTRAVRQFTLGVERHRLVCQLCVADNGPGIPESIRETLFYPMISGRAEGTGLGLSIAQSIINQHQGLIECESEPGKTQFLIYIPLELKHEGSK